MKRLAIVGIANPVKVEGVSASQLFDFALHAANSGDARTAITIYEALERDKDVDVRCEARFRHGESLQNEHKLEAAAILYRAILDEKPKSQRVRLELAKVLAFMGHLGESRRELRQAQAGGLPPEISLLVGQFSAALRARRPLSGAFEVAFAPSTNVNRATSATTLDTVIAPLQLSPDARATSGIGVNLGGQIQLALPITQKIKLSARGSSQNTLYRAKRFDDSTFSAEGGVELQLGRSVLRTVGSRSYRFYGGHGYATINSGNLNLQHPLGKRSQMDIQLGFGHAKYLLNNLQSGDILDASVAYEGALSVRAGGRVALFAQRQTAYDPGYAFITGGGNALLWHELGKATVYATVSLSRLEGDARLSLFLDRRREWLYRAGIGSTFRQIKVAGFSPVIRVSYEHNISTVGIYSYKRLSTEFAITKAF
jgi:hypothetical protein